MDDLKEKTKEVCEMKDNLIREVSPMIQSGVFCETVDGCAVGQVIDMIKDLADAEKNIAKACYYKKIVEAMEKEGERANMLTELSMMDDRAGYDNYRYPSSGRFAPTGSGKKYGYPDNGSESSPMRMSSGGNRSGNTGRYGYPMDNTHGMAYNEYSDAKRYFHESNSPEAKQEMAEHANRHMRETIDTTKEIWADAKPEMKKEFKRNMMELLKTVPD